MEERRLKRFMISTAYVSLLSALIILALVGLRESLLTALGGALSLISLQAYRIFSAFLLRDAHVRPRHSVLLVVLKFIGTLAVVFGVLFLAGARGLVFFLVGYLAFVPASVLLIVYGPPPADDRGSS